MTMKLSRFLLALIPFLIGEFSSSALAQIIPDATLGSERSRLVESNGIALDRIEGGAIRGSNLFHSFSELNVNPGQRLYFANPDVVQNIFTRVTGGTASTISGVLGVEGAANLFLLNPNGVLFTQGAGLDLRGSLVVSTANAIRFGDRGLFSATNPQAPALLNVSPSALLYTQIGQGGIRVQTTPFQGLDLRQGQSILLVGGNVLFENGGVFAPGGRLEVGGLAGVGEVAIAPDLQLSFPANVPRADIVLQGRSRIDGGDGGQIMLTGRNLRFDARDADPGGAQVFVTSQTQPGRIALKSQETIEIFGNRSLDSISTGAINAGDLTMQTRSLIVRDGGSFRSLATGTGRGANITIDAIDAVEVFGTVPDGQPGFGSATNGAGRAGDLTINTNRLSILRGGLISTSALFGSGDAGNLTINANTVEVVGTEFNTDSYISILRTETFSEGSAGNLTINTRQFSLRDGGLVSSRAFAASSGRGGTLTLNASESAEVVGVSQNLPFALPSLLTAQTDSSGNAGTLNIATARFSIRDGAEVSTQVSAGSSGQGGQLILKATNAIDITGADSRLSTRTLGLGNAGDIDLSTAQLRLADGAEITASTESGAIGGTINLRLNTLQLSNQSLISALSTQPTGQSGNLNVEATAIALNQSGLTVEATQGGRAGDMIVKTRSLNLNNQSRLSVSSPEGSAGQLDITARQVLLNQSRLTAETGLNEGIGAEIDLRDLDALVLRRGSQINASANNRAQGGNIGIDAAAIVAVPNENSDIRANAFQGRGGNVTINTQALFGIAPASASIAQSDITASSELGVQGEIAITQPDVQPTQGLVELPIDLVDASNQIAQVCRRGLIGRSVSRFVVSGRGSTSPSPIGILSGAHPLSPLSTLVGDTASQSIAPTTTQPAPIVEAQGWIKTPDGKVVLVTQPSELTPSTIAACPTFPQ